MRSDMNIQLFGQLLARIEARVEIEKLQQIDDRLLPIARPPRAAAICPSTASTSTGAVGELLSFASARARASSLQAAWPPNMTLSQEEIETARWSYAYSAPAGRGTRVKAELDMTLQPLDTADGTVAVLALKGLPKATLQSLGFTRLLGSICRLSALAVEHSLRKSEVENARIVSQTEGLRSALLTAISHDFGTPLASIIGSASSLISFGKTYRVEVQQELLTTILEEAERLNRFVKNVLQMTRLE